MGDSLSSKSLSWCARRLGVESFVMETLPREVAVNLPLVLLDTNGGNRKK